MGMKTLKTFNQEAWHEQHPVSINTGAIVTVDGVEVNTPREQALAWILLRLNAQVIGLQRQLEEKEKSA